jgi:hypothetical protein
MIPKTVRVIGKLCFARARVAEIDFEDGSRLERIKEVCLEFCTVKSIRVPQSVVFVTPDDRPDRNPQISDPGKAEWISISFRCFVGCTDVA